MHAWEAGATPGTDAAPGRIRENRAQLSRCQPSMKSIASSAGPSSTLPCFLEPQTSHDAEVGVRIRGESGFVRARVPHGTRATRSSSSPAPSANVNLPTDASRGRRNWKPAGMRVASMLSASYTYTRSQNSAKGSMAASDVTDKSSSTGTATSRRRRRGGIRCAGHPGVGDGRLCRRAVFRQRPEPTTSASKMPDYTAG